MISFESKVAPPNATTPFEIRLYLGLLKESLVGFIKALFLRGWHCGGVSFQIHMMYTAYNNSPLDPLLHLINLHTLHLKNPANNAPKTKTLL